MFAGEAEIIERWRSLPQPHGTVSLLTWMRGRFGWIWPSGTTFTGHRPCMCSSEGPHAVMMAAS